MGVEIRSSSHITHISSPQLKHILYFPFNAYFEGQTNKQRSQ